MRLLSIGLAFALCGCGSIGAIGLPPLGKSSQPTPPVETGGLPPTTGEPPPTETVVAEPLPGNEQAQGGLPAPVTTATAPAPGGLGRTDLLGGWTISASGDSCQLFMTLTSWTGGYRASTRGCNNAMLKSISAWNLEGKQVTLAGAGGVPVARLSQSGAGRFDGTAEGGGGAVTFYR
ncbi:MAG TPA: AprI/Inh family metalloprotease inhibitor [Bauldia sp.]|nr:AprI/Inh family metalloprotease inhibitor [Bauldia sp.]